MKEFFMKNLEKQGYRLTGKHSAVKICNWTRESIRDKGICYKQEFYGIKSHECCQMTPCLTCNNSCTFCWRSTKNLTGTKLEPPIDTPEQIINNCIVGKLDIEKLPTFDIEYLFLRLRAKSIGENVTLGLKPWGCPKNNGELCENSTQVEINLEKVNVINIHCHNEK